MSRFAGEAESALADRVALDLVGSAGEALPGDARDVLAPRKRAPLAGVGDEPSTEESGRDVADPLRALRRDQLPDGPLGARGSARFRVRRGTTRVE